LRPKIEIIAKILNYRKNSKLWQKFEIIAKIRFFCQKFEIFCQKSKLAPKMENFGQMLKLSAKIGKKIGKIGKIDTKNCNLIKKLKRNIIL